VRPVTGAIANTKELEATNRQHCGAIWAYLACGILFRIYYGAVVVSVQGCNLCDVAFSKIDSVLLFGHSVIEISHRATALIPCAEFIYLRCSVSWALE
jgi:hypothetical protein